MRKNFYSSKLIFCASFLLASPALAQNNQLKNNIPSLDEVTVYATKSQSSTFDVPAIVSKIDASSAANSTAGDLNDLLEFTAGVDVIGGPRRNDQKISIRGFDDEAVITLIDGRRQNFESAHDGRFYIDPNLLKSVEIVKGASSSIYGGGAIGGVVAFETKEAKDLLNPGQKMGALTSYSYRSATKEHSPSFTVFGNDGNNNENFDIIANISHRKSDDIKQGDNNKLQSKDRVISAFVKAGYKFADHHKIQFNYQTSNNDGQEPNNGSGSITSSNPIINKKVADNQFALKYEFNDPANSWVNLKTHIYRNITAVEEKDYVGSNSGREQERRLITTGFNFDNQSKLAINDDHIHKISLGFEVYKDEQKGTRTNPDGSNVIFSGVPTADANNYGVYLQDEINLASNIGDFTIIPAARFDSYQSDDRDGNSQDESKLSPKLALTYKPNDNLMFFGSWARAFRAPNLTEIYAAGQHFPGVPFVFPANFFIPNPDLKPETVDTVEFGAGIDFDNVVAKNDRVKVKGSWFRSEGENLISQAINTSGGTTTNFNVPNALLEGFELEGSYQISPLTIKLGLSYVKATNDDTKEFIDNNMPLTLVSDVSYQIKSIDSLVGFKGRFAKANRRVDTNEPIKGYSVYDLYYRFAPAKQDALTIDLGIDNIFDKAYTRNFAALLEEGRSYVAKVSWKF